MPPFSSQLERCLDSFDGVAEWADIISFLSRLSRILNDQSSFSEGIPHEWLLGKRLAQCLNVSLPVGVHSKAFEVYSIILGKLKKEQISEFLPSIFMGLFVFADACPSLIKRSVLSLFDTYILQATNEHSEHIKCAVLALLSFLDDKSSEYFDMALERLTQLVGRLTEPIMYNVLSSLLITCGPRRQQIFLMMDKIAFSVVCEKIDRKVLYRGILASLSDSNVGNVRDTLAFLSQNLKLDTDFFDDDSLQWNSIIIQAFLALRFRDSSIIRRLNQWWGIDSADSCLSRKSSSILIISLKTAIQTLPDSHLHHLSVILTAMLDNKYLSKFIIPELSSDLILRIYRSPRTNVLASFFEIVELQYIWDPIVKNIFTNRNSEMLQALNFAIDQYPIVDDSMDSNMVMHVFKQASEDSLLRFLQEGISSISLFEIISKLRTTHAGAMAAQGVFIQLLKCVAHTLSNNSVLLDVKYFYSSKYVEYFQSFNVEETQNLVSLVELSPIFLSIYNFLQIFTFDYIAVFCDILKIVRVSSSNVSHEKFLEQVWCNFLIHFLLSPTDALLVLSRVYDILGSPALSFICEKLVASPYLTLIADTLLASVKEDFQVQDPFIIFLLHVGTPKCTGKVSALREPFKTNVCLISSLINVCHDAIINKSYSCAIHFLNMILSVDLSNSAHSATNTMTVSFKKLMNLHELPMENISINEVITFTVLHLIFVNEYKYDSGIDLDSNFSLTLPRCVESIIGDFKDGFIFMLEKNILRGCSLLHLEFYRLGLCSGIVKPSIEDLSSLIEKVFSHIQPSSMNKAVSILSAIFTRALSENDEVFEKLFNDIIGQVKSHLLLPVSVEMEIRLENLAVLSSSIIVLESISTKVLSACMNNLIHCLFNTVSETEFLGPQSPLYILIARILNKLLIAHPTLFMENLSVALDFDIKIVDIRIFTILKHMEVSSVSFEDLLPNKPSKYDRSKVVLHRFMSVAILSQIECHKDCLQGATKVLRIWCQDVLSGSKTKQFLSFFLKWLTYICLTNSDSSMQDVLILYVENFCLSISRFIDKSQTDGLELDLKSIFTVADLGDVFDFIQDILVFFLEDLFNLNSDYEIACGYILSLLVSPMWRSKSHLWTRVGISIFSSFPKKRISKLWKRDFWEYFLTVYSPFRCSDEMYQVVCECLGIYLLEEALKVDDIVSRTGSMSLAIFSNRENELNLKKDLLGRLGMIMYYCPPEGLFDQVPIIISKLQDLLKDDAIRGDVYRSIGILFGRVQTQVLNPFIPALTMYTVSISRNV